MSGVIPPAGSHGGDAQRVAAALGVDPAAILDLSASMNPVAPDPLPVVQRHLRAGLDSYPDPRRAHAALAEALGVDRDRLLVTNGGAEAIALLAAEVGGRVQEPDFGLYPRGKDGPLWRSNPHNPGGMLAEASERADVWDEAFYPMAAGSWSRGDDGLARVGSLTKLLAAPGLRIGYLVADPELVARCAGRQPEWSVNGLVSAALPDLLGTVDLAGTVRGIAELREQLTDVLRGYGLSVRDTDANWVLVDEPGLRERLAPHGVLVRDCASFGMSGVARIAVPRATDFEQLAAALQAALGQDRT